MLQNSKKQDICKILAQAIQDFLSMSLHDFRQAKQERK